MVYVYVNCRVWLVKGWGDVGGDSYLFGDEVTG